MHTAKSELLYERDFNLWLEDTAAKLRQRDLHDLDWDNLIEELEALGKREKRELTHRLEILLIHLLKRIYIDSTYDNRGWELTIREQRRQLQLQIKQSPSLERYFAEVFDDCWQYALAQVKHEYARVPFPQQWEFSQAIEALLFEELWRSL